MHLYSVSSTFVVGICNGPESLLAGSVPDLQFDVFAVRVDSFESEVYSDGGHIVFVELVVCEPQQEAAFADR